MNKIKEMSAEEFVRRIKNLIENHEDSKFVFFLGSGCSVSSGIPAAKTLVKNWLPRLKKIKTGNDDSYETWAKEFYPDYQEENAASLYGTIVEDLFLTPNDRQMEIERITEGKDPGFGYAVLAQLMTHKDTGRHCNVVQTVNFDDMIADALYLYTQKKPLVISHESLAGFVRITRTRPLVLKLHGDSRLAPKNTEEETGKLEESVKKVIKNQLNETGLIFIGYGGNDESIAEILGELPSDALPWGVYWVGSKIPEGKIGDWLNKRNAVWVNHRDFDELMLLMWKECNLSHPTKDRFDKLLNTYGETFAKLKDRIEVQPDTEEDKPLKEALEKATKEFDSWWAVELEARKYKNNEPENADRIYRQGLKRFSNSYELNTNYAIFSQNIRKEYDIAEKYYIKALKIESNNGDVLALYALFLHKIRKEYDRAEGYYVKALEIMPNSINFCNYAGFLLARENDRGYYLLDKAIAIARNESDKRPIIECLFYQYAHYKDRKLENTHLKEIKILLNDGVRSTGFVLSDNVETAIKNGHLYPNFLEKLSKVISEEIDITELDDFEVWQNVAN